MCVIDGKIIYYIIFLFVYWVEVFGSGKVKVKLNEIYRFDYIIYVFIIKLL